MESSLPRTPFSDVSNLHFARGLTPGLTPSPLPSLAKKLNLEDSVARGGDQTASKTAFMGTPIASTKRRAEAAEVRSSELRREKAALELRILDLEASLAQATAPAPGPAPTPVPCPGLPELEALSLRASAAEEQSSRVESELASTRAQARALEQVHAHLREEHGRTADALSRSLEELESVRCSLQVLSCRGPGEARAEGAAEEYRALYAEALAGRSSLECLLGSLGALMRGLEAREEELRGAEEQLEQAMDLVAASSARYAHALSETARQRALAESAQERQAALALEVAHIRAALDRALADRAALGDAQAVARGLREEAAGLRVRLATAEDLNGALRAKLREAAQDSAELDSASDRTAALLEALEHQRVAFEALGAELAAERELSSALITERERLSGALAKERAACDQAAGALLTAEGAIDLLRDELERARAEAGATPDRSRARIEALKHENNRMARAMDVLGERARRAEGAREAREGAAAETVAFLQAELEGMAASERVLRAELAQASGRLLELGGRLARVQEEGDEAQERASAAERAASDLQSECDRLRSKLGSLEAHCREEMGARFRAEEEAVFLRAQLASTAVRLEETARAREAGERLLEQERAHLAALRGYVDSLATSQSAASPLLSENRALEQRCRLLEAKVAAKDQRLGEMSDAFTGVFMELEGTRAALEAEGPGGEGAVAGGRVAAVVKGMLSTLEQQLANLTT